MHVTSDRKSSAKWFWLAASDRALNTTNNVCVLLREDFADCFDEIALGDRLPERMVSNDEGAVE